MSSVFIFLFLFVYFFLILLSYFFRFLFIFFSVLYISISISLSFVHLLLFLIFSIIFVFVYMFFDLACFLCISNYLLYVDIWYFLITYLFSFPVGHLFFFYFSLISHFNTLLSFSPHVIHFPLHFSFLFSLFVFFSLKNSSFFYLLLSFLIPFTLLRFLSFLSVLNTFP